MDDIVLVAILKALGVAEVVADVVRVGILVRDGDVATVHVAHVEHGMVVVCLPHVQLHIQLGGVGRDVAGAVHKVIEHVRLTRARERMDRLHLVAHHAVVAVLNHIERDVHAYGFPLAQVHEPLQGHGVTGRKTGLEIRVPFFLRGEAHNVAICRVPRHCAQVDLRVRGPHGIVEVRVVLVDVICGTGELGFAHGSLLT